MTEKLYDYDSYATEFDAVVIECEKHGDVYKTVLDRTLFFPEEGGQCSDRGVIDGCDITHVELSCGTIYHISSAPFEVGKRVCGKIDFELRFRNMQNHSGEHIICGIAHKLFGYENVGFHLGENVVTMDLSGELSDDDIQKIEYLANQAVVKNMPVTSCYPSDEELQNTDYRAKGDIKENVRLVTIGDVDCCACCAPHVKNTGEIGIIKILDAMRHRGGMRLSILCGFDALRDYRARCRASLQISNLLSVKQGEIADGVAKLLEDINSLRAELAEKGRMLSEMAVASIEPTDRNVCLFCDGADADTLRHTANNLKEKTSAVAVVFSGTDADGYRYVMAIKSGEIADIAQKANAALGGRGGGKGTMASGRWACNIDKIRKYFDSDKN